MTPRTPRTSRRIGWAFAVAGSMLVLAACSGPVAEPAATSGSEDAGKSDIRIGLAAVKVANPAARQVYAGFTHRSQELGMDVKVNDANLDINKQISDIDEFINSDVDAIIIHLGGDPNAVRGPIQRAIDKGIRIFSIDELPGIDGVDLLAVQPSATASEAAAEWIIEELGGEGQVAVVGGPAIPVLKTRWEAATKVFESQPGIELVERQDSIPDDAGGGRLVAENLLNRYPDLDAIWTINDSVASGVGQAIRSAGRDVLVTGINGDEEGIQGIKEGYINATWDTSGLELGRLAAEEAYRILSGDVADDELPIRIDVDPVKWTTKNVSKWQRPEDRIPYPGLN